jgi:hypothetical protein
MKYPGKEMICEIIGIQIRGKNAKILVLIQNDLPSIFYENLREPLKKYSADLRRKDEKAYHWVLHFIFGCYLFFLCLQTNGTG